MYFENQRNGLEAKPQKKVSASHILHFCKDSDQKQQGLLDSKRNKDRCHLWPQNLSIEDLAHAEEALVCDVQKQHFQEEMAALQKGNSAVNKSSPIYKILFSWMEYWELEEDLIRWKCQRGLNIRLSSLKTAIYPNFFWATYKLL